MRLFLERFQTAIESRGVKQNTIDDCNVEWVESSESHRMLAERGTGVPDDIDEDTVVQHEAKDEKVPRQHEHSEPTRTQQPKQNLTSFKPNINTSF